ncbi:MAG TPA: GGDEF domain-containing protein [Candidatus Dormibacteraeota bacterium]
MAAEDRAQAARDREDSGTDELTGVSRRGAGLAAIGRELNRAQRDSGELVAAYVDVDGLKATNDTTGHAAGDALLIAVADSLRTTLRSYDVITRVGGDEFVCVLPGISVEHARQRFEAVSAKLSAGRSGASITVGLARHQAGDSADDLIQRADDEVSSARKRR